MNGAIIKDGVVVNVAALPDDWTPTSTEWQPPEGCECVISDKANIGDRFVDRKFRRVVVWNDEEGRAVPLEIDVHNPPPEVIPVRRP